MMEINATVVFEPSYALGTAYTVVCMLVMMANALVIFVIVQNSELHLPTLWIIANLAAGDFILAFIFMVCVVPSAFMGHYAYSQRVLNYSGCLIALSTQQVFSNTAITVFDRAISVKWPLRYPTFATKRTYRNIILGTVLLNLSCLPDVQTTFNYDVSVSFGSPVSLWGLLLRYISIFGSSMVIILGIATLAVLRFQNKPTTVSFSRRPETCAKATITILLTTSVYILSYVPAIVLSFLRIGNVGLNIWFPRAVVLCYLSSGVWNVFIYTGTYRPFREALMSVFCKTYLRSLRQAEVHNAILTSNRD